MTEEQKNVEPSNNMQSELNPEPEPLIENDQAPAVGGLDDEEEEDTITVRLVKTNEDDDRSVVDEYTLPKDIVLISSMIKTTLENQETNVIDLLEGNSTINQDSLKYIVEYMNMCQKHNSSKDISIIPKPLKSKNIVDCAGDNLPKEILEFVNNIPQKHIYKLIETCNYLRIEGFMHALCAVIAGKIKGEPLENIKNILNPYSEST